MKHRCTAHTASYHHSTTEPTHHSAALFREQHSRSSQPRVSMRQLCSSYYCSRHQLAPANQAQLATASFINQHSIRLYAADWLTYGFPKQVKSTPFLMSQTGQARLQPATSASSLALYQYYFYRSLFSHWGGSIVRSLSNQLFDQQKPATPSTEAIQWMYLSLNSCTHLTLSHFQYCVT